MLKKNIDAYDWINVRENRIGAIKNGQSRDNGNIGHTRHRKKKKKKH